jgi:Spy/CpxP family protein refolding chaperone
MKLKWIVPLALAAGALFAVAAFAADTAKKQAPTTPEPRKVVKVVVSDDGAGNDPSDGSMVWTNDGDDLGMMAFDEGDEGDAGGGGDDGKRIVIRRRMVGGPGMGGMMHRGGPIGMGLQMRFAALDLTDAQRQKMADLHERQARRAIQVRADLQLAAMDLRKLVHADNPSGTAINAQIDKIARMRADLAKSRMATFLEARAMLTPEQQKKLKEGPMGPMRHRMMMHEGMKGGSGDSQ